MFITRTCYHDVGIIILLSYDYNGVVKTVKVKTPNLIFSPTCIFADLRKKFFKPYFCHWPNLNKFDTLMMSNSKHITLNIAKFIFHAQDLRKNVLSL